MLRPLGDVFTLIGLVGVTLAALKWLGVVALVGADPVTVALLAVSIVLIVIGLSRQSATNRPDETPPPTKAPPLTLADAPPHESPSVDPNLARALMRGRGEPYHTPLATAAMPDDTDLYRRAAEEARQMQERLREDDRRATKRSEMKEVVGGLLRARADGQRLLQDLRYADSPLLAGSDAVGDPESRYDPWAKQVYELIDRVPTHLTAAFHVAARPSEAVPDFPLESVPTQLRRHVERILSALEIVIEGLPETYREAGYVGRQHEPPQASIHFDPPWVERRDFKAQDGTRLGRANFLRLAVVNDGAAPVHGAHSAVRVDSDDGDRSGAIPLLAEPGRWEDAPEAAEITIEPNGRPYYLDPVMQPIRPERDHWYAWTREGAPAITATATTHGFPGTDYRIGDERFIVRVGVRGSNIEPIAIAIRVTPGFPRPHVEVVETGAA